MKVQVVAASIAVSAMTLMSGAALAQGAAISVPQTPPNSYAGASFGSPIAFGADWGAIGGGVFGQTLPDEFNGQQVSDDEDFDGSAALVVGLGDADRYAGLEVAAVTTSLTGSGDLTGNADSDDFAESGLHRGFANRRSDSPSSTPQSPRRQGSRDRAARARPGR